MPLIKVLGILVVGCTGVILPLHTAFIWHKLFTQTERPPCNQDVKEGGGYQWL
jgi:hypothetical protein